MRVTLAQTSPMLNRSNLSEIVQIVSASKDDSDLIVFGELSLNGYILQDKLYEDAWEISELKELESLSLDVDIVVGGAIKEGSEFRNKALYFSAGEIFESFKCGDKKISMVVCEDLWHQEAQDSLKKENPDLVIALVASPARGFSDQGLEIENQWMGIIKKVSKECHAKLIFVNRVGFEDGLGFWGGSCIVDEDANIVHKLPHYEKIVKTFNI